MNARISALQAFIAVQSARAAADGELPASLDELVPAYFPNVPLDAADGAAIRYSPERAVIWSVGANNHEPTDAPPPPAAIEYRLHQPDPSPAAGTDA